MKKTSRYVVLAAISVSLATPLLVFAQSGINLGYIAPYSKGIENLINNILIPVLMAIAFITFLWGVYKYFIFGAANESEKAEGRKFAMWGIIGFVIIVSLWGIVALVRGTFGLTTGNSPTPPTIGGSAGTVRTNCAVPGADNYGFPGPCTFENQR